MNSFQKLMVKRKLKKKVSQVQNAVKKTYKNVGKKVSAMRVPLKVSLTR
jgi:hypothetical protein